MRLFLLSINKYFYWQIDVFMHVQNYNVERTEVNYIILNGPDRCQFENKLPY